jgi:hypothetical protein
LSWAIADGGEVGCPSVWAGVRRTIPGFFIAQKYLLFSCLFQKQNAITAFAYEPAKTDAAPL